VVGGKLHDLEQEWAAELSVRDADVVLVVLVLRFLFPSLSCSTSMAKVSDVGKQCIFGCHQHSREQRNTRGNHGSRVVPPTCLLEACLQLFQDNLWMLRSSGTRLPESRSVIDIEGLYCKTSPTTSMA
jgi:hypothetical protein